MQVLTTTKHNRVFRVSKHNYSYINVDISDLIYLTDPDGTILTNPDGTPLLAGDGNP